jgi:hypothetical protein
MLPGMASPAWDRLTEIINERTSARSVPAS